VTTDRVIAALQLPAGCQVDQRVAKKLLVEHGAPTAADKRRIKEGVEDLYWVATLKPTTVGVPAFRDDVREYLEIAVMSASLRDDADVTRIVELIHRAIPYPVVLVSTQAGVPELSVAHKRASQGAAGATVLDGSVVATSTGAVSGDPFEPAFIEALSISRQPRADLFALYDGWMNAVYAVHAARVTGTFGMAATPESARVRRDALQECARLSAEIARLRTAALKERQLARQVDLNLQLKRAEQQRSAASRDL
jgi:hypothetical protein